MNVEQFLAAKRQEPFTHRVTTHYADGRTKRHDTHSAKQAENWAVGERRKIGRDLIDRATGRAVRVVRVTIIATGG